MRVAAVDLGTNTTRLLVADVEKGRLEELSRRVEITRLGEGVDERRKLLPLAIARVRNVLVGYRRELERLGAERTLAVATSAVRDADNGEAFLGEMEWSYGFSTRLLSGDDEALLTLRGVAADRELSPDTVVVDIGGGSTELVAIREGSAPFHVSLELGSVRLTERFLHGDPPSPAELAGCARSVRALLRARVPDELRARTSHAIGVAGTVTSIAALDLGLVEYDPNRVEGHWLARAAIEQQLQRLAAMPLAERRKVPGLEPERAPVVLAGAVIAREVLDYLGLEALEGSEHDLLDGAAFEAAALPERAEGEVPPGAFTCC